MTTRIEYQLDLLKMELETVNASIRQMDEITKSIKEWTIGLWTAAVGGALATAGLTRYVVFTAVIPLLFWLVDTWHRRIQRKFIWRGMEIGKFLNSDRLQKSLDEGRIVDFEVFDPQARRTAGEDGDEEARKEFKAFVRWQSVMFFPSLAILYLGLALVSAIVGVLALTGALNPAT